MTQRPRTFTFYSYKGGVGRSMALLNVAYTLHSMGRHVLIVDLDLEAPGVSGFLRRNEELAPHDADKPDVVDLLKDVLPLARWQLGDASRPEVPVLANYLREVKPLSFAKAQNPRFRHTRLDVVCASDERDYTNRLAALDIASLSAEDLAETGNVLREIFFRHQFPWAWQQGDEDQPTCYDYILIDSRTGFTETSGLCIGPLADRLVIFCGLNDQNINGTAEFLRVVGLKTEPRTKPWDDADDIEDTTRAPSLGDKPTLLVASPVPAGEMEMKKSRFAAMEEIFGTKPHFTISYHPRLSVFETVFLRDASEEAIAREYRRLTEGMLALVGDHPGQLRARLQPQKVVINDGAKTDQLLLYRFAASADEGNRAQFASLQAFLADRISDSAKGERGAEADDLFAAAVEKYQAALLIKPDYHEALYNWGNALLAQAEQKTGGEADALFIAAGEKYQAALALKPDKHEALNNWGNALAAQAEQKTGGEADALFVAAGEKYQAALLIKPDDHEALYNWGITLVDQAEQKTGGEAAALFTAAGEKYQAALTLKPDYYEALDNWGNALLAQAEQKTGGEADALFTAAGEKYQAALLIKPDKHEALYNWGNALLAQAQQKTGAEADAIFAAAEEKYKAAIFIKPNDHKVLYNWGIALAAQAQQKAGGEADALFAAAGEKYQATLTIKPDDREVLYNLGCLAALRKDSGAALEWLQKAIYAGEPATQEKLTKDTDFDPIRETPEFKEFLAKLPA